MEDAESLAAEDRLIEDLKRAKSCYLHGQISIEEYSVVANLLRKLIIDRRKA
jgi:hypothetical protein